MKDRTTAELEAEVQRLQERVEHLSAVIQRLAVCKQADERYPYWNWLVERNVTEQQRVQLEHVLGILDYRRAKEPVPAAFRKEIAGLDSEQLYRNEPPSYREAAEYLRVVMGTKQGGFVPSLLQALLGQQKMQSLCLALLAEFQTE